MSAKPSIAFFGSPEFAAEHLAALLESSFEIRAVVTQPDKVSPKGVVQVSAVKLLAQEQGLRIIEKEKLSDLRGIGADLFVVVAYGAILPAEVLAIPRLGCLNVHASLLPLYRGPSPIQAAILSGDKETGISVMLLDEKMDHGPVLAQKRVAISPTETGQSLHGKLAAQGKKTLVAAIEALWQDRAQPQEQDHGQATYTKLLARKDGHVAWDRPAREIERQVRAFSPWPGTFSFLAKKRLKILATQISEFKKEAPAGTLLADEGRLLARAADGWLELSQVQMEGKPRQSGAQFAHGYHRELAAFPVLG